MAQYPVSKSYPQPIDQRRWIRNGRVVRAGWGSKAAQLLNHCLAFRRKQFAQVAVNLQSIPAGASGTNTYWYGAFHAGIGAKKLAFRIGMAKADTALSVSPYVDLQVGPVNGTLVATNPLYYGGKAASPNDSVDEFHHGLIEYDLPADDTLYEWRLRVHNYARPIYLCGYEVCGSPVWDSDGAVDPQVSAGSALDDEWHQQALDLAINLRNSNARHIWGWTRPSSTAVTLASGGASSLNLLDATSTSVSSSSAGFTINNLRHRTVEVETTPCLFMVRASQASGAGTVKLSNGTVTFTLPVTSTLEWQQKAIQMPVSSAGKWDVLVDTGGNTMQVDAISLFEYGGAVLPASQTGFGTMAFGTDPFGNGP